MSRSAVAVLLAAGCLAGCTSATTGTGPPMRRAAPVVESTPGSGSPVSDSACSEKPSDGALTQAFDGLAFRSGSVGVTVARLPPTQRDGEIPDPAPENPDADNPDADNSDADCYTFPKWGNVDAVVPPDSALFTFSDSRSNGVQIEMPLAELVSRRRQVTAQVGVVAQGRYFQAISCTMQLATVTSDRVAGEFTCRQAVLVDANPFLPTDEIDPADRSAVSPQPAEPASPDSPVGGPEAPDPATAPTARLSGWFEVLR